MKPYLHILICVLLTACSGERPPQLSPSAAKPDIFPDYIDVTIPAQIAPMNFNIEDDNVEYVYVKVTGNKGGEMESFGSWADFNEKEWHELTAKNVGGDLTFDVSTKDKNGQWHRYAPFMMHVSDTPLTDYGVVYRKIAPGYQTFSKTGIYQRELASFDETPVLEETAIEGKCLNCHYSNRGRADQFSIHVRGKNGGTVLSNGDKCTYLNTKTPQTAGNATYGYWHPEGRYIAFSVNKIVQNFYLDSEHNIEPWDVVSDLLVLDTETNQLITSPLVATPRCETTPAFSPDGKKIYFCMADSVTMPGGYNRLKYNLCSIDFDAEAEAFGTRIDTIICADTIGKSVSLPRPSYDGKFLMYNLTDHGTSPIHHADADLWIMNLETGQSRPLTEVNSDFSDAYHNWSPGGGWFLFNSKRLDGMYGNLYFSCIGRDGKATKPFLLPQHNPRQYYDEALHSFNAPDFIADKINLDVPGVRSMVKSGELINVSVKNDKYVEK